MIIIWVRLPFHKMLSRLLKLRHLYFKNDCKKFCNYCARVFTKLLTNCLWFIICVRLPFQMTRSRLLYLRHTYFKKECNKFVKRFMKTRPVIHKTHYELMMFLRSLFVSGCIYTKCDQDFRNKDIRTLIMIIISSKEVLECCALFVSCFQG